ncbi:nitroreductase family protein [Cognatiyoonia sp. IB215446]|nr:nitroreductase family protein [Cognatiyoonia sp. IB215446]MDX8350646.1 nitroreductase family protein [Cognatiyoonia sp. IB215446]
MNLRVAGAAAGYGSEVVYHPDPTDEDVLADLAFSGPALDVLACLSKAIPNRRTYRKRFESEELPVDLISELNSVTEAEGARLSVIHDEGQRQLICDLVVKGDALQWDNPSWRRELAQWMHPRRAGDGLAMPALAAPLARALVRRFDLGNGVAAQDHELANQAPLLAVISTEQDRTQDWLSAGQALQRFLLTAAVAGAQASYLNQPIEIPELRAKVSKLVGDEQQPQILLRAGYPEDTLAAAPRRPLGDVIVTH